MYKFLTFSLLSVALLTLFIKGSPSLSGSLNYQTDRHTNVGGPFESSNSNSRYALVEAIVDDNSFFLSDKLARFATPDLVRIGNKYISIFTPGVSFIAVPFYMVGKAVGMPQIVTYISTVLLALANAFLVSLLARRLGSSTTASYVAGMLFLFGTNALAYAQTLTQHHAGIFVVLLAMINVSTHRTILRNIALGALFGAGLLIDIPNGIILFPVMIYALSQHLKSEGVGEAVKMKIKLSVVGLVIGLLPLLGFFAWYNYQTTGSYTMIGQTIGRYDYPVEGDTQEKSSRATPEKERKLVPYETRNLLEGFYILLVSDERGWVYYSPIILFGILGLAIGYQEKNNRSLIATIVSVIGVTLLTYSMFGDPWGGWSFGPRYLLPATALVCVGIALALERYKSKIIFGILLVTASIYSIWVNVLGGLTTNAIAPKVEAINLPDPLPYTYTYNLDFLLNKNFSSSLVYNLWLRDSLSAYEYFLVIGGLTTLVFFVLYITSVFSLKKKL